MPCGAWLKPATRKLKGGPCARMSLTNLTELGPGMVSCEGKCSVSSHTERDPSLRGPSTDMGEQNVSTLRNSSNRMGLQKQHCYRSITSRAKPCAQKNAPKGVFGVFWGRRRVSISVVVTGATLARHEEGCGPASFYLASNWTTIATWVFRGRGVARISLATVNPVSTGRKYALLFVRFLYIIR